MNCKKGDIARIVGMPDPVGDLCDKFVTCVELYVHGDGVVMWRLDRSIKIVARGDFRSAITGEVFRGGETLWIASMPDQFLRPIRGGDGADETLTWRRTPAVTGEHPKRQAEFAR